ncbi:1-(5-phosphoribosyl)-5-[(5- phosphoribosylamino)methylideneamino] imidazole-4-carboxamide isomerase [Candidatus Kinetoplastibacterium sorsogonicusi]|uniref:1-(5-phosphoribosyl)-5-[(5-phosphoribosylamino)methylideneamino] imidazole-4-carboxamide isomerase n=1 Tax=Candidatus Kinetoplastidibacterium kentomonadis TaxID=1576550 RepID=A0A3Q8ETD1_9PROT|nr:1-(5-phosphoribosyl)-5-[(5-phosphoribosylamino)methylideneamino]imidazole-4-carboxamide isomerase [Candidatus Kinetoplastibacterium sorsogonicusi]AWD32166.1 1-(5-phosphoribosyl)-5-[(5- phosphoribosylamino)methylideneamino] imidazole-4-carboxamide isomerase [Candidatus Kinetoplastibacterium sorsogonicusi]
MLLIPAIDLKDGQCVRLRQGKLDNVTIFSEEPHLMALDWCNKGAKRLHIVDLDGAVSGKPKNNIAIKNIIKNIDNEIPIQLGGGIRELNTIEYYLDLGISYIIIGTAAIKNPGFLHDACAAFPGKIIVGLDANNDKIAIDGWSKLTRHNILDIAKKFEDYGCEAIIYTDISRDGMLSGVNIESTSKLAKHVKIPVFASGGIVNLDDIKLLCSAKDDGISGAILGRSVYEGTLNFQEAQKLADDLSK